VDIQRQVRQGQQAVEPARHLAAHLDGLVVERASQALAFLLGRVERALGQVRLFLRHLAQERDLPVDLRAQTLVVHEHGEVAAQHAQERAVLRGVAVAATLRPQAEHGHDIPAVAHREEQHG